MNKMSGNRTRNMIQYLCSDQNVKPLVSSILGNRSFYEAIHEHSRDALLGALQNMFVSECVKANQYVRIGKIHTIQIYEAYRQLIDEIHGLLPGAFEESNILHLVIRHRRRLVGVLESFDNSAAFNEIVPCAEYSVDFQKTILRIDQNDLPEPILDVGCGRQHSLVNSLLQEGYSMVYGLDQYTSSKPFILSGSWIEWDFGLECWGTVISHMAFSNHCRNAIFVGRDESAYRAKYFQVLRSLKIGGTFIYTPRIQDFEKEIDEAQFIVTTLQNSNDRDLDTVIVRRKF